jgi:hypothetical protein
MDEFVRPISRLAAVELPDSELDVVSGGSCPGTDYMTPEPCNGGYPSSCWKHDGYNPNDC